MQASRLGRNPAGPALLRALGSVGNEHVGGSVGEAVWAQRAVDVYREALSAGYRPRHHVLERVLACLRQPQIPKAAAPAAFAAPFQVPFLSLDFHPFQGLYYYYPCHPKKGHAKLHPHLCGLDLIWP